MTAHDPKRTLEARRSRVPIAAWQSATSAAWSLSLSASSTAGSIFRAAVGNYFGCDRSMLETLYQTILHGPRPSRRNSAMKLVLWVVRTPASPLSSL